MVFSTLSFRTEISSVEWVTIIAIASKLGIKSLKDAALSKAQASCTALELVDYGRKYDIFECFSAGIRMLCMRDDHLTLEEGEVLGLATVIEIARARELLAKGVPWNQIGLRNIN